MRAITAIAGAAAAAVLAPPAQAGRRVDYTQFFTTPVPGASTGTDTLLLYKHPDDPNAKPIRVQREVFTFPEGTTFDGSFVPDCTASDEQVVLQGSQACPSDTWVGGGLGDTVMTGFPGAGETPLEFDAFDEPGGAKLIAGSDRPPVRFAAHAVQRGTVVTVDIPPSPGGPPDGETAIRRVNNYFPPRSLGKRAYTRTPPTCPASGVWTFKGQFTFADGFVETEVSSMRCDRDVTPPLVRLGRLPRRCTSRAFVTTVRVDDASPLTRVRVRLDGRVLRETTAALFTQTIGPRKLRAGRHRVSVTARDAAGNQGRHVRHFRRCS